METKARYRFSHLVQNETSQGGFRGVPFPRIVRMKLPFGLGEFLPKKEATTLRKAAESGDLYKHIRPVVQYGQFQQQGEYRMKYGTNIEIPEMQQLAEISSVYRQITTVLAQEIFRNGADFEEKFVRKCINEQCGKEFDFKAKLCDSCGKITREPNYVQLKNIKEFVEKANDNNQSLLHVCKQMEKDIDTVDDGYLLLSKEYEYNADGEIITAEVKEAIRVDPALVEIISDKTGRMGYDYEGKNKIKICPEHRFAEKGTNAEDCHCGKKLLLAGYRAMGQGQSNEIYYLVSEIIHVSKYSPSLTYGFPPFLSLYQKLLIELDMDYYLRRSYDEGKGPTSMTFVKTKNAATLRKFIDQVERKLEENPHHTPVIGVEGEGGGNFVQHVDMMKPLTEMQATEFRNIIRREMGALFEVMPIFQGDLSSSGGLNNEGLQVTVTNRGVEMGQGIFNNQVFPVILQNFGVTDYNYTLQPSEEKDEMAEKQRFQIEIQNAEMMRGMGFDVKYNDEGEFEFSGEAKPVEVLPEQRTGGFGGGFGGFGNFENQNFQGEPESVRRSMKKSMTKDYQNFYRQYGDSAKAVGWADTHSQIARFEVASDFIKDGTVLDVGAGLGHFAEYLKSTGRNNTYEGIDIVPEYVEAARYKGIPVHNIPLLSFTKNYDYLVALGTFSFPKKGDRDHWQYTKKSIQHMYRLANKGVVFSLLTKKPEENWQVFRKQEVEEFLRKIAPRYTILTNKQDPRVKAGELLIYVDKKRVYLKPGENPPEGANVQVGPNGGRYYDTGEDPPIAITAQPTEEDLDQMREAQQNFKPMDTALETITAEGADEETNKRINKVWQKFKKEHPQPAKYLRRVTVSGDMDYSQPADYGLVNLSTETVKDESSIESSLGHEINHLRLMEVKDPKDWFGMRAELEAEITPLDKPIEKARPPNATRDMLADANVAENEVDKALRGFVSDLDISRRPGKADMRKRIKGLIDKLSTRLQTLSKREVRRIYSNAMEEVGKQLNQNLVFTTKDRNTMEVLANSNTLTAAYDGMTANMSEKINEVIDKAYSDPETFTIDKLVNEMKSVSNEENYKLRRIARNETHKINVMARENNYLKSDPYGEKLYKWIGPTDKNTTDICKRLKAETKLGVPLGKLKRMTSNYEPHIQCRHTFVMVV